MNSCKNYSEKFMAQSLSKFLVVEEIPRGIPGKYFGEYWNVLKKIHGEISKQIFGSFS